MKLTARLTSTIPKATATRCECIELELLLIVSPCGRTFRRSSRKPQQIAPYDLCAILADFQDKRVALHSLA
jgi:hypothetical protein